MLLTGFTFPIGKRDIFVQSFRKNKTEALAKEIIRTLLKVGIEIPENPDTVKEILWYLQKANLEIQFLIFCGGIYE